MPYITNDDAIAILNQADRGGSHYDHLEAQLRDAGYVTDDNYSWRSPDDIAKGVVKRCKLCAEWILTREYGGTELGCLDDRAQKSHDFMTYTSHELD